MDHNIDLGLKKSSDIGNIHFDNGRLLIIKRELDENIFDCISIQEGVRAKGEHKRWDISHLIRNDVRDREIQVYKDLNQLDFDSNSKQANYTIGLLLVAENKDLVFLEVDAELKLKYAKKLKLEKSIGTQGQVIYYKNSVYVLYPDLQVIKRFEIVNNDFKNVKISEKKMKKHITSFAVLRNGTFLFIESYSKIYSSPDFYIDNKSTKMIKKGLF